MRGRTGERDHFLNRVPTVTISSLMPQNYTSEPKDQAATFTTWPTRDALTTFVCYNSCLHFLWGPERRRGGRTLTERRSGISLETTLLLRHAPPEFFSFIISTNPDLHSVLHGPWCGCFHGFLYVRIMNQRRNHWWTSSLDGSTYTGRAILIPFPKCRDRDIHVQPLLVAASRTERDPLPTMRTNMLGHEETDGFATDLSHARFRLSYAKHFNSDSEY
ncbi:hypothetical protein VNO77_25906 [Canavalia gladiata]|uniref:Uncharacterized protein n=1 Tax=Canavalia gladiata TaxID=3824 RepID=A0AAN9KUA5_CANGL